MVVTGFASRTGASRSTWSVAGPLKAGNPVVSEAVSAAAATPRLLLPVPLALVASVVALAAAETVSEEALVAVAVAAAFVEATVVSAAVVVVWVVTVVSEGRMASTLLPTHLRALGRG